MNGANSVESCAEWILEHDDDEDIDDDIPLVPRIVTVQSEVGASDEASLSVVESPDPTTTTTPTSTEIASSALDSRSVSLVEAESTEPSPLKDVSDGDDGEDKQVLPPVDEALLAEVMVFGFSEVKYAFN
jgi:hypothetical protein